EGLGGAVALFPRGPDAGRFDARPERCGDRGEDATGDRSQDGREGEANRLGSGAAQVLLDLRDVTVRAGDGVRGEVPGRLGGEQVRLERLAGPGVPDGERGDHVPGVDDPAGHTRLEREGDSGDVAPGNGDTA